MTLNRSREFYEETCCACGVVFLFPIELHNNRRITRASFYCPNGHGQSYTRTTADDLRDQVTALELERDRYQQQRDEAQAREVRLERRLARARPRPR